MLEPVHQHVRNGPLAPLLSIGNWDDIDPDIQPIVDDDRFRSLATAWSGNSDGSIYDNTLHLVRKCWAFTKQPSTPVIDDSSRWCYDPQRSGPMMWMYFCSAEFLDLLHQRQPPALLLFAYVGILFHQLQDRWYLESWGRDMISAVDDILGDYWANYMTWPKEVAGL